MNKLYLVEGETEKALLNQKISNAINIHNKDSNPNIEHGKIALFNPYCAPNINKVLSKCDKKTIIILIIDSDLVEDERFIKNIKSLSEVCNKLIILTQTNNFEDELVKICNCNKKKLYSTYGTTESKFKNAFINSNQCIDKKFKSINWNKYCEQTYKNNYKNIEYKTYEMIMLP